MEKYLFDVGNYFVNFLNIQAYSKNSKLMDIKTYDDFVQSACDIIILISDNACIEMYSKNIDLLESICSFLNQKNILYHVKTTDNDSRTIMWV